MIPFVFYAMHQQNDQQMKKKQQELEQLQQNQFKTEIARGFQQTNSIWDDLWEEITSGTEYAIRANLNEILPLIKSGLEHQSWKLR
jgi:hypothetical protein